MSDENMERMREAVDTVVDVLYPIMAECFVPVTVILSLKEEVGDDAITDALKESFKRKYPDVYERVNEWEKNNLHNKEEQ